MIIDVHTHNPLADNAIINIAPGEPMLPGRFYSVGIHPWHAGEDFDPALLEACVADDRVVAIGETGLDGLCGVPEQRQVDVFLHHVELSEKYRKPLIIHAVRRHGELLRLHKQLRPTQPWILHGYRGKPGLTRQLLDEGFMFSIGEKFNPESVAMIPRDRLMVETDESQLPIAEIAARAGIPALDRQDFFTKKLG